MKIETRNKKGESALETETRRKNSVNETMETGGATPGQKEKNGGTDNQEGQSENKVRGGDSMSMTTEQRARRENKTMYDETQNEGIETGNGGKIPSDMETDAGNRGNAQITLETREEKGNGTGRKDSEDEATKQNGERRKNEITGNEMRSEGTEAFEAEEDEQAYRGGGWAVLDARCDVSIAGKLWFESYRRGLPEAKRREISGPYATDIAIIFEEERRYKSLGEYEIPMSLYGKTTRMRVQILNSDIPLMISRKDMERARTTIDAENEETTPDNTQRKMRADEDRRATTQMTPDGEGGKRGDTTAEKWIEQPEKRGRSDDRNAKQGIEHHSKDTISDEKNEISDEDKSKL